MCSGPRGLAVLTVDLSHMANDCLSLGPAPVPGTGERPWNWAGGTRGWVSASSETWVHILTAASWRCRSGQTAPRNGVRVNEKTCAKSCTVVKGNHCPHSMDHQKGRLLVETLAGCALGKGRGQWCEPSGHGVGWGGAGGESLHCNVVLILTWIWGQQSPAAWPSLPGLFLLSLPG